MKFKTDENLPVEAAEELKDAGFDAETVWDEALAGAPDSKLADRVRREGRVLVTLDLDFVNIKAYPPDQNAGIIVLRLDNQGKETILRCGAKADTGAAGAEPGWRIVDCPAGSCSI